MAWPLVLVFLSSCGNNTTFVMKVRDSSQRTKPNSLFGKVHALEQGMEKGAPVLLFGDSQVGSDWTEDATTVTTNAPIAASAFGLVGWLELDGVGGSCTFEACAPTSGDAVIRAEAQAGATVVFTLDFK